MSGKSSKKIGKIILWVVAGFLLLDLLLVGLLFVPSIQTYAVNRITQSLSDKWGTEISMADVHLTPTLNLVAHDFRICDHHDNDMIFVGTVKGRLLSFSLKPTKLKFRSVVLKNADVVLRTYTGEQSVNISIWAKKFKKEKKSKGFLLSARCLELCDSRFVLIKDDKRKVFNTSNHPDFDYAFLELKDINWDVDNFKITSHGVTNISAKFKHLAFSQYGGFTLEDGHGEFSISDTALIFNNCFLTTPNSKLETDLKFLYHSWHSLGDFTDSVRIVANIGPSLLCMSDVAGWAPAIRGMDETFFLMADRFDGPVNDFEITGLQANWNMFTQIDGDIALKNVTHFKDAYINLNLNPSHVNVPELAYFTLPKGKTLPINSTVAKLGNTSVKGSFDGSFKEFDAHFDLNTGLGKILADLSTFVENQKLQLDGSVESPDLNLAKLTGNQKWLGHSNVFITLNGHTNSPNLDLSTLTADVSGNVKHLDLIGYRLKNITIDGEYRNLLYNCSVAANDPHFDCDVLAQLDLTDELPALQGNISLQKLDAGAIAASLPAIDTTKAKGLDKVIAGLQHNPTLTFSFDNFNVMLRGNNLENVNGYAGCDNIMIYNDGATLSNDRLRITAINNERSHKYILASGLANATVETNFPIKSVKDSLQDIAHNLFPTLIPAATQHAHNLCHSDGYFKAHMTTYRTRPFTRLIAPNFYIAPNSVVDINITAGSNENSIYANIPSIGIRNKGYARGIALDAHSASNDDKLKLNLQADSVTISMKNPVAFSALNLDAQSMHDTITYKLNFHNISNQQASSISQLSGLLDVSKANDIILNLRDAVVYFNDNPWQFNDENAIHFRNKAVQVSKLKFYNSDGQIYVNGTYSKNPDDRLICRLINVDLGMFNSYLSSMSFDGDLSADITIRTRNDKTVVLGKALADDFVFNNVNVGNLFAVAGLDTLGHLQFGGGLFADKNFDSDIALNEGYNFNDFNQEKHILANLSGNYAFDKKSLVVKTTFDTLNAGFVAHFLSGFSDHFTGTASGNLDFYANPDSTYFVGTVRANHVNMGISSLGTSYDVIDQDIRFNSQGIFFDNMRILDKDSNIAFMNGSIKHRFFRDMLLDLHLTTDRIMAINSPKTPTALFYGDGYVSGQVDIFGPSNNITFRGPSLRTLEGSRIVLQVTSSNSTSQSNTIYFKPRVQETSSDNLALGNTNSSTNLNFDFTFDVTKDADVVLYLESIGGTMSARAEGRFQLLYNDADGLNLHGQLGIYSGDFKIALYNVVNSRFTLVPGGRIIFDGPLDNMDVSISAYKSSKTSLSNIVPNDILSGNSATVNAYLHLNGQIMQKIEPTFSFQLPNSSEEVRNSFYTAIDTANVENLTKQFAYFMVTNNFMANDLFSSDRNAAGAGASLNFFSNVVNNLIGNMIDSKKGHFGITYNQATETSSAEYGVNASANLLKDRMSIETSIGYYDDQNAQRATNMYGDFTVEYSLNDKGTWKVKAYTYIGERDDEYVLHSEQLNYTAGVALAYKQDFGDLRRKNRTSNKHKKRKRDEKQ